MQPFRLGFAIEKVDDELRQVWGTATVESPDLQGDIVDFGASVDAFSRWPGNIREQHDRTRAIGKCIQWDADSDAKCIRVGAYISKTDDGERAWQKVKEGVLRGFSIGGTVVKATPEVQKTASGQHMYQRITRYDLSELSLVDNPAHPEAVYDMVKSADGLLVATDILEPAEDAPPAAPADLSKSAPNGGDSTGKDEGDKKDAHTAPRDEGKDGGQADADMDPATKDAKNLNEPDGDDADQDEDEGEGADDQAPDASDVIPNAPSGLAKPGEKAASGESLRKLGSALGDTLRKDAVDVHAAAHALHCLSQLLESEQGQHEGRDDGDDQLQSLRDGLGCVLEFLNSEVAEYGDSGQENPDQGGDTDADKGLAMLYSANGTTLIKAADVPNTPLQRMHDLATEQGALCRQHVRPLSKSQGPDQEDDMTPEEYRAIVKEELDIALADHPALAKAADGGEGPTLEKALGRVDTVLVEVQKVQEAVAEIGTATDLLKGLDARLKTIEDQPVNNTPALFAVEKSLGGIVRDGATENGPSGLLSADEEQVLQKLLDRETNPQRKQTLGSQLALNDIRKTQQAQAALAAAAGR